MTATAVNVTTQVATDLLLGRLTPTMAAQAVCQDWVGHRRLYGESETTWRKSAEQKRADWADGCGWCGGHLPVEVLAAAHLQPDSLPEVAWW